MRAIYKKPGKAPEIIEIENDLSTLQKLVGGYIEVFPMASNADIICNEEGKLRDLPYNITLLGEHFVGPILVVGVSGEDFCDLENAEYLLDVLGMHPEAQP